MIQSVLSAYGFKRGDTNVEAFGKGLINYTWKIISGNKAFILQRINDAVFKRPQDIADNIKLVKEYLDQHHPEYQFVSPIASLNEDEMIFVKGEGFFRLFPFVTGSHTNEVVATPGQAYEAAVQFGRFTRMLSGVDLNKFKVTIPSFHDLTLRYREFLQSLGNGNKDRINESIDLIETIISHEDILTIYEQVKTDPSFHLRVTHHDTKISNVLFDKNDKGLCVIDLDTVMPGYFISDVGDMMRTYLSPVSEEEKDFGKIEVRDDFYKAIVQGYQEEMKDQLTETEKKSFFYAGKFMIYMQAIRFLNDYLNDDSYYGEKYPRHNLRRAENQLTLLTRLLEKEKSLTGS